LIRPTVEIAVAINRETREADEWFEDPDDLPRLERALTLTEDIDDPLELVISLLFRVAYSQAFGEGNKRTALLLAVWVADKNGLDRKKLMLEDDEELGSLLVNAAAGLDVEREIRSLLTAREGC
jgi:prophage maintenance system killer protein